MEAGKAPMVFLVCMLLVPVTVQAATVHGGVYDLSLEKVQGALVEIDGQQMVSQDGTYSLEVGLGSYMVSARELEGGSVMSAAEEEITIGEEGTYRVDLILFPTFQEEEEILNETEGMEPEISLEEPDYTLLVLAGVIIVIALLVLIFWKVRWLKPVREPPLPGDLDRAVRIIRKSGGRMTQKELRKELGLSEAKVSLMITDLEHRDLVKRVKKGRGNVLILK